MGPYCKFCDRRCFVPITFAWPKPVADHYGTSTIAATCPAGQEFEKQKLGVCYDDAKAGMAEFGERHSSWDEPTEADILAALDFGKTAEQHLRH